MKSQAELNKIITVQKREIERLKKELDGERRNVKDSNIAFKLLIQKVALEKKTLEERVALNLKNSVIPLVEKLKKDKRVDKTIINAIDNNINNILSPLVQNISSSYYGLSRKEVQVASLIQQGLTTRKIADVLEIAKSTVDTHRDNIRKKMDLKGRGLSLKKYLKKMA
ncbi:MAG: helix-turn-helix transcriptional regulator [Desulfobacterales bacterium]|nr:helix-turn-helix transcriptional regulator [Desulfobacterales bacterium]MCP4160957.1 helix-turn-helix transcriptional regulator [Deltaproteobacteria bacterium]